MHPHTAGLEVRVLAGARPAPLDSYQHQYLYVLDGAVDLTVGAPPDRPVRELALGAGDSAYVKPYAGLSLRSASGARVLVLRIGGAVSSDVRYQLGVMAPEGRERYLAEDRLWYSADETGGGAHAVDQG
jgi:methylphosphonate synthase